MIRALLAGLLALAAPSVEAALPLPPFELTLSATSVGAGEAVTVRVAARPGAPDTERYDVYLLLASAEEAAFLTPEGGWAARPVLYARAISTADPPIVRRWPRAWPPGQHALGLVVVPPSGDPLARDDWRYRPAIARLRVAPARPGGAGMPGLTLGVLAAAAAAAVLVVWWAGRPRPSACGP